MLNYTYYGVPMNNNEDRRVIRVDVGNMPKEKVSAYLENIKQEIKNRGKQ